MKIVIYNKPSEVLYLQVYVTLWYYKVINLC